MTFSSPSVVDVNVPIALLERGGTAFPTGFEPVFLD
jgi:hypothetical protein